MYTIRCADSGTVHCNALAKAETMDELMEHVRQHLRERRGVNPTATILKYLRSLVKEI